MGIYLYDSGQYLFDRALWGLLMVAKAILKAIVYMPLWFAGYIIAGSILDKGDSAFVWLGLILLFAVTLYQAIFFLKGVLIGWMNKGNVLWILLLVICVGFTCIFPTWIIFEYIEPIIYELSEKNGRILTWIFSIGTGLFVYSRYHFVTDIAPDMAYPAYQLGVNLTL